MVPRLVFESFDSVTEDQERPVKVVTAHTHGVGSRVITDVAHEWCLLCPW
jgi:hypothetical protein